MLAVTYMEPRSLTAPSAPSEGSRPTARSPLHISLHYRLKNANISSGYLLTRCLMKQFDHLVLCIRHRRVYCRLTLAVLEIRRSAVP